MFYDNSVKSTNIYSGAKTQTMKERNIYNIMISIPSSPYLFINDN